MLIFLLLIIEVTLLFVSFYLFRKDLLRPSVILLIMFTFSTFIAALNVNAWNIDYSINSIFILTVGFLSAILADYIAFVNAGNATIGVQSIKPIYVEKWKLILVSVFGLFTLYLYYGEIRRLAIISGYVDGGNLLWHFRNITSYQAEESLRFTVNLFTKGVDAIGYVMTFIVMNNFLSKKIRIAKLIPYCIPIFIFIAKVLMGSGRLELLRLAGFAFVVSYILNMYRVGWKLSVSRTYFKKALIIVPIALVLFFNATSIIGRSTTRTFSQYISTYAGGSIQHFNQYIQDPVETEHFGEETFPGVYSFLNKFGLTDYTRPVHLEMRQLGVTKGNVYTFFRRPYADFGLVGMSLMTFVVFYYFSKTYSSFKIKRLNTKNNLSIIMYSYLVYWILLSSIEQYSVGIVSLGAVMTLVMMKIAYSFFTKVKF